MTPPDDPRDLRFAAPRQRRAALVTGGARGLGRAMALRIAAEGRDVVIADLLEEQGKKTAKEIAALGQRAIFVLTDVTIEDEVAAAAEAAINAFKRLDILVCAAGVLGLEAPFHEQSTKQFSKVLEINLHGVYHAHQAAIPHMRAGGWGRCVTITSGARRGAANQVPYAVSKGGVYSLVQSLGNAYAGEGVFVNGIEPGRALTDMVVPRFSAEHIADPGNPLGRYSDPEEVAEVAEFLCSERNTYTTGSVWSVKGATG
ncbi:MAG: SDR family oxidoreductase [Gemmatimonadetes bacterium]|jgi:NAD(P)-dependent dehydrogenase (short-subunit alcohol dehydrogenase family)|nr:SDR family oxidoreductase [Gemmatimonadota bacterium]MBT5142476.1 SDR family oxidoreductase [Gemmatimonadota bacterium]MBT5586406.1 SDR family oxidoreductase [Gemmatimonadota bacterium]MBT5961227.1 SDR family oxidoreductase [Gemmatimonadota bacterium]MBT7453228.1 SDR family oxidoreductase [Gemmatimonadota bacterium]